MRVCTRYGTNARDGNRSRSRWGGGGGRCGPFARKQNARGKLTHTHTGGLRTAGLVGVCKSLCLFLLWGCTRAPCACCWGHFGSINMCTHSFCCGSVRTFNSGRSAREMSELRASAKGIACVSACGLFVRAACQARDNLVRAVRHARQLWGWAGV